MMQSDSEFSLLTDLYELTMAQAYFEHGMHAPATFSLLIRKYPPDRGYFVAAGLEDVLDFLETLSFSEDDIAYKLVNYDGRPTPKLSQGKATLPDAKQVYRYKDAEGMLHHDLLALEGEQAPEGSHCCGR